MENKLKVIDIDGEKVNLGKSSIDDKLGFGWRVVYPIKNENGTINWINLLFGGKKNLMMMLFILIIIAFAVYGFYETTESCRDMAKNPCKYFGHVVCADKIFEDSSLNNSDFLIYKDEKI